MTTPRPAWPRHPDGRPKKMAEMTREEQAIQVAAACARIEKELAKARTSVNRN